MATRTIQITIIASILSFTAVPAFAQDARVGGSIERAAGNCDEFGCGLNGTSLDGVAVQVVRSEPTPQRAGGCDDWGCGLNGTSVDGVATSSPATDVEAVALPCGERIELR